MSMLDCALFHNVCDPLYSLCQGFTMSVIHYIFDSLRQGFAMSVIHCMFHCVCVPPCLCSTLTLFKHVYYHVNSTMLVLHSVNQAYSRLYPFMSRSSSPPESSSCVSPWLSLIVLLVVSPLRHLFNNMSVSI